MPPLMRLETLVGLLQMSAVGAIGRAVSREGRYSGEVLIRRASMESLCMCGCAFVCREL